MTECARRGPRPTRRRCRRPRPRGGAVPDADFSASISPSATTRPRLTITTSSHTSSTRSSWCELNTTPTPAAARSRRTSVIVCDAERVEARERLVEDEQLRVVDQRRRELDPLLVAVGQVLQLRLRAVGEAEPLEPDGRRAPSRRGRTARGAGRSTPAARRRASAGRGRAARACTRTAAACPRRRASRPSDTSPASGDREPEDAAHRRRLAGAVGPEEAEQPAAARRQRRAVERRDAPVVLGQAPDLEHRRATIADPVERATTPPGVPGRRRRSCAWISGVA